MAPEIATTLYFLCDSRVSNMNACHSHNLDFIISAGRRMVLVIFKEDTPPAEMTLNLGYQLGAVVAPLITTPFLDENFSGLYYGNGANTNLSFPEYNSTKSNSSHVESFAQSGKPLYPAKFVEAFWIVGGFGIALTMACLAFHIHRLQTGTKIEKQCSHAASGQTFQESLSPKNLSSDHPYCALAMLILLSLLVGCVLSIGRVYAKVIFSYARDGPGLSVQSASMMNSAFFTSSTVGALMLIVPMMFIHIKYIIQVGFKLNNYEGPGCTQNKGLWDYSTPPFNC